MTLGDAFNRRKRLSSSDLQNWINRLNLAGAERRSYRTVKRVERKRESFSDKGLKIEEVELLDYEIDRIADYAQRVKQAINRANKTELVELD